MRLIMLMQKMLIMLKPDLVRRNKVGAVLQIIEDNGFNVKALRMDRLDRNRADIFYSPYKEMHYYEHFIKTMLSGNIVVLIVEAENAIDKFQLLKGATNPSLAREGTLRQIFGLNVTENSVHGSESVSRAEYEINFFFKSDSALIHESKSKSYRTEFKILLFLLPLLVAGAIASKKRPFNLITFSSIFKI